MPADYPGRLLLRARNGHGDLVIRQSRLVALRVRRLPLSPCSQPAGRPAVQSPAVHYRALGQAPGMAAEADPRATRDLGRLDSVPELATALRSAGRCRTGLI